MTQEALKLALEALEEAWYHVGTFQPTEKAIDLYDEARTAIKEALVQTQEPDYWLGYGLQAHTEKPFESATPIYTTPPQRTWVGLTDEDMKDPRTHNFDFIHGARWAEAKLKEKNT
jgi:hypothetical protein